MFSISKIRKNHKANVSSEIFFAMSLSWKRNITIFPCLSVALLKYKISHQARGMAHHRVCLNAFMNISGSDYRGRLYIHVHLFVPRKLDIPLHIRFGKTQQNSR